MPEHNTRDAPPARQPRSGPDGLRGASSAPRPDRPSLRSENLPPVLVKHPPPLSVRLSQLLWAFSFVVGAVAIVFFFVVREDQLPLIAASIKAVDGTRSEETYSSAADIVFWSFFGIMVTLILIQITLLVSFMSRRDGIRWWQLGTLIVQAAVFALMTEMVGGGRTRHQPAPTAGGPVRTGAAGSSRGRLPRRHQVDRSPSRHPTRHDGLWRTRRVRPPPPGCE